MSKIQGMIYFISGYKCEMKLNFGNCNLLIMKIKGGKKTEVW